MYIHEEMILPTLNYLVPYSILSLYPYLIYSFFQINYFFQKSKFVFTENFLQLVLRWTFFKYKKYLPGIFERSIYNE